MDLQDHPHEARRGSEPPQRQRAGRHEVLAGGLGGVAGSTCRAMRAHAPLSGWVGADELVSGHRCRGSWPAGRSAFAGVARSLLVLQLERLMARLYPATRRTESVTHPSCRSPPRAARDLRSRTRGQLRCREATSPAERSVGAGRGRGGRDPGAGAATYAPRIPSLGLPGRVMSRAGDKHVLWRPSVGDRRERRLRGFNEGVRDALQVGSGCSLRPGMVAGQNLPRNAPPSLTMVCPVI
jgi:hypothetical protein